MRARFSARRFSSSVAFFRSARAFLRVATAVSRAFLRACATVRPRLYLSEESTSATMLSTMSTTMTMPEYRPTRATISAKICSGSMLIMRLCVPSKSQRSFQNSISWKNVQKLVKSSAAHVPRKPKINKNTNEPERYPCARYCGAMRKCTTAAKRNRMSITSTPTSR
ncbi:hypothetical protein SDC9_170109 [bioreactor metagenome]|uniref:Uncharacterized protein n=1 Tax=bioreactor metagenome TaxID=1076179 RepID=A0A645G9D7_9ZZZZ